jgi:hypothetical protein
MSSCSNAYRWCCACESAVLSNRQTLDAYFRRARLPNGYIRGAGVQQVYSSRCEGRRTCRKIRAYLLVRSVPSKGPEITCARWDASAQTFSPSIRIHRSSKLYVSAAYAIKRRCPQGCDLSAVLRYLAQIIIGTVAHRCIHVNARLR